MKTFKKIKAYGAFEYVLLGALIIIILIGMMNKVKANFGSFDGTKKGLVAVENFFKTASHIPEDPVIENKLTVNFYSIDEDLDVGPFLVTIPSRSVLLDNSSLSPTPDFSNISKLYEKFVAYPSGSLLDSDYRLYKESSEDFVHILPMIYTDDQIYDLREYLYMYLDVFAEVKYNDNPINMYIGKSLEEYEALINSGDMKEEDLIEGLVSGSIVIYDEDCFLFGNNDNEESFEVIVDKVSFDKDFLFGNLSNNRNISALIESIKSSFYIKAVIPPASIENYGVFYASFKLKHKTTGTLSSEYIVPFIAGKP